MIFYTNATNSLEVERDIIFRLRIDPRNVLGGTNILSYEQQQCKDVDDNRPCYSVIVIVEELTKDAS